MELITNRESNEETYEYTDLNRVETAVETIASYFPQLGIGANLITKTDWGLLGYFSVDAWPVSAQMSRYLGNVAAIKALFPNSVRLPSSMDGLTCVGANNIEKVLQIAMERIGGIQQTYRYSGEIFAGEE